MRSFLRDALLCLSLIAVFAAPALSQGIRCDHMMSDIWHCDSWVKPYPNKYPTCEMQTCRKYCLLCPYYEVQSKFRGKCC